VRESKEIGQRERHTLTCSITILVKAFVVQTQEISFTDCMMVLPATSETGDFVS